MTGPVRIQLSRAKGWRMPHNTVNCARGPGRIFGNPFTVAECRETGFRGSDEQLAARCVDAFRVWLGPMWRNNWDGPESAVARDKLMAGLQSLRGKNLACWCPLDQPCHVDVLMEIANGYRRMATPPSARL